MSWLIPIDYENGMGILALSWMTTTRMITTKMITERTTDMCGIIGYLTTEEKKESVSRYRFLHQALIADTMRGDDSTGAYFVGHDAEVGQTPAYCKSTAPGYDFVTYDPDWHSLSGTGAEFYAAIGHNRSATVGKVAADTAHPFQRGPITLVHNGTLRSTYGLPITEQQGSFFNDSDAICGNLENTPINELTKDMLGAYALVWHDARDRTMNIVRNDQRPLYLATVKGQNTVFIASESMMLQWILSRLKVNIETIAYPKPHQWLRFEHGSLKPEVIEVPKYTSTYQTQSYGGYGGYGSDPWGEIYEGEKYEDDNAETRWVVQQGGPHRPKGQGPTGPQGSKNSSTSYSRENRITIGGRKRMVPTRAQELLLEVDLLVEDREKFEPLATKEGTKSKFRAVYGYLTETGMSALIHGVPAGIVEATLAFQRTWVVQPLTVRWNDESEPVVICKLRHTDAEAPTGRALLTPLEPYSDDSQDEEETPHDTMTVDGASMGVHEYMNRTGGGCIRCSGNITLADADDLIWVNEGRDPVCPTCVAECRAEMEAERNADSNSTL
jgi:hypothetical protein